VTERVCDVMCDVITLRVGDEVSNPHLVHQLSEQSVFIWSPTAASQRVRDETLECLKTHEGCSPRLRDRQVKKEKDRCTEREKDRCRETGGERETGIERQVYRDRQVERERETDVEKQTGGERERERERGRERETGRQV